MGHRNFIWTTWSAGMQPYLLYSTLFLLSSLNLKVHPWDKAYLVTSSLTLLTFGDRMTHPRGQSYHAWCTNYHNTYCVNTAGCVPYSSAAIFSALQWNPITQIFCPPKNFAPKTFRITRISTGIVTYAYVHLQYSERCMKILACVLLSCHGVGYQPLSTYDNIMHVYIWPDYDCTLSIVWDKISLCITESWLAVLIASNIPG